MLKIVVYDSGYGGEFFADQLQEELPIIDIVRVIDWRNADKILYSAKEARRIAKEDLRPYIGRVDLIIFANHLLTITSLKHFKRKYKNQRFIGLNLKIPDEKPKEETLVLTTKAVAHTINYHNYLFHLPRRSKTLTLDSWPSKIDDGELSKLEIKNTLEKIFSINNTTKEIILACSQFQDIKPELKSLYGRNLKIYDSFDDTIREVCKVLRIRGGIKKIK